MAIETKAKICADAEIKLNKNDKIAPDAEPCLKRYTKPESKTRTVRSSPENHL